MRKTFIYALIDPRDEQIKYVGKSDNPEGRLAVHIKRKVYKVGSWIKSLEKLSLIPRVEILDEVEYSEWPFWEKFWICLVKSWGFELKNISPGGDGGKLSNESVIKLREMNLGDKNPFFGKKHTIEAKLLISQNNKGQTRSDSTKQNISNGKIGHEVTPDVREILSQKLHGNKNASGKRSPEFVESLKQRKFSEESRQKMSAARKAYWDKKKV